MKLKKAYLLCMTVVTLPSIGPACTLHVPASSYAQSRQEEIRSNECFSLCSIPLIK